MGGPTVAPYRVPDQETEDFIIFYSPTFDLDGVDASAELFATHRVLRLNQMELTLAQLAKHITRADELLSQAGGASFVALSTETEKALVKIYADIFNLTEYIGLLDISAIKILEHLVLSSVVNYINSLLFKGTQTEEYDPNVPLQLSGNKTPIFFVHRRAVTKTRATGSYVIASHGYGGIVAFEVAKRLEAIGDEVKFVGLVNIPPDIAPRMKNIDWTPCILSLASLLSLVSKHDTVDLATLELHVHIPTLQPHSNFSSGEASYTDVPGEHHLLMDLEHVLQFMHLPQSSQSSWVIGAYSNRVDLRLSTSNPVNRGERKRL
ncbi:hypothetical protein BDR07DRAFT_1499221 [Suillus spraguei]|nr:hypothetical protein BDR07DRAFT_1499221 [Suillus spraguei]